MKITCFCCGCEGHLVRDCDRLAADRMASITAKRAAQQSLAAKRGATLSTVDTAGSKGGSSLRSHSGRRGPLDKGASEKADSKGGSWKADPELAASEVALPT